MQEAAAPGQGPHEIRSPGHPQGMSSADLRADGPSTAERSRLPTLVVLGAMKAGTTAVHGLIDAHPQVQMSRPKELNFFSENWDRGTAWYSAHFDEQAVARGESSPGYTSPSYPRVAERMARLLPDVRLVYLVRHPFERAMSQYAHHRRDGDERRPVEEALLDPDSQYVARSRYFERLRPFLDHFDDRQLLVVVQERLLRQRAAEMTAVFSHFGVDPSGVDHRALQYPPQPSNGCPAPDPELRRRFWEEVADDVQLLTDHLSDRLTEWEVP